MTQLVTSRAGGTSKQVPGLSPDTSRIPAGEGLSASGCALTYAAPSSSAATPTRHHTPESTRPAMARPFPRWRVRPTRTRATMPKTTLTGTTASSPSTKAATACPFVPEGDGRWGCGAVAQAYSGGEYQRPRCCPGRGSGSGGTGGPGISGSSCPDESCGNDGVVMLSPPDEPRDYLIACGNPVPGTDMVLSTGNTACADPTESLPGRARSKARQSLP